MVFQPNVMFVLVVVAAFCVSYSIVFAKTNTYVVQDLGKFEAALRRAKRETEEETDGVTADVGVSSFAQSIAN